MSTPLHSRAEVGLAPPRSSSRISPSHLTAHYAGPSPWAGRGFDHARCATIWRGFQSFHMSGRGWSDIAYSSGVCPHGHRYEGRGPGVRTAANGTNTGNSASLATCYIGGDGDVLTDEAKAAFLEESLRFGVPLNRVHSDWKSTSCPGDPTRGWVKAGAPAPVSVPVGAPDQSAIDRWNDGVRARARELLPFLRELPDLWPGAADLHVVRLQQGLNLVTGARLVEDGRYGARTVEAVRNFQRFFSLHVDGITGSPTRFFLILSTQKLTELP